MHRSERFKGGCRFSFLVFSLEGNKISLKYRGTSQISLVKQNNWVGSRKFLSIWISFQTNANSSLVTRECSIHKILNCKLIEISIKFQ